MSKLACTLALIAFLAAPQHSTFEDGLAALERGDFDTAIRLLEAAAAASPGTTAPLFHLGRARLGAGDFSGAAASLRAAQESAAAFDVAIGYQLGVALMRAGDHRGAGEQFEAVLQVRPEAIQPLLSLGWISMQLQQSQRALELFDRVLAADPGVGLAHYYVGLIHHGNGRFDQAAEAYGRALEVEPGLHSARVALGRIALNAGDSRGARELYEQVVGADPDFAEAHFQLGLLELREGNAEAAVGALERAVALDPEHAGALYNLGIAYARAERSVDASIELETFAALRAAAGARERSELTGLSETRADVAYRAGVEALRSGQPEAASQAFASAIEIAGPAAGAEMYLGSASALLLLERAEEARRVLEEAVRREPELAEAHRLLADTYALLGLSEEAERERATYRRILAERRSKGKPVP